MTDAGFDALALEALKALGKAMGQMHLYRVGHPAVAAALEEAQRVLAEALSRAGVGELAYSVDQGKVVANGRVAGSAAQMPNAVLALFNRYKLRSLSFRAGVEPAELAALCEMAGLKPEQLGASPADYLVSKGAARVRLDEAVYAKVSDAGEPRETGQASGAGEGSGAGPGSGPGAGGAGRPLSERLEGASLEDAIRELAQAAAPDPGEAARVAQRVLSQLRAELELKVREATRTLQREKTTLHNEALRTQAVLTHMAEGVVVVDEQGKILMMNPAAEQLYGVKLVEAAGKPLAEHAREEHLLALAPPTAVPQDAPLEPQVGMHGSQDARRTLRASTAVVQTESGKTVGMVSVLSDVSKHKELDRMEREFTAHVTHELRAPLAAIRAALEILQGQFTGRLESDDAKMFATALKNADRLDDLIRNILDFSKIESGQMTVHPAPADPAECAREGTESLKPWALKKGIALELSVEPELPRVLSDQGRSVQVLVNLLSNAIKFTPAGGRVSVRVARGAGQRERFVLFSVADTGPGIAKAEQARVFEKFAQIAAGEKHVGGTGLGLSIAKALVHLQGGQLWLESDAGRGATFHFTLPVHVPSKEGTAQPPPAPKPLPWWKRLLGLR